jgi:phosphatidylglycerophosphatase A
MSAPDIRFLLSHPAHFLALGFGAGLLPKAPGTWGTLVALPIAWATLQHSFMVSAAGCLVALLIGPWVCGLAGKNLGVSDHGGIVWDEIVAMWGVLLVTPLHPVWWVAAFALFRLFDIWKPFPVGWADRTVKGGLGVMLDDVLAAAWAVLCILAAQYFFATGLGGP